MYPRYSFFVILVLSLFIIPSLKAGSKKPTDDPLLDKKQDVTTENNNTTFSLNRSTVKPVNSTLFFPSGFLETLPFKFYVDRVIIRK